MRTSVNKVFPPIINHPRQGKNESDKDYNARVYRWRTWQSHEPRPDLWYSSDNEIREYKQWLALENDFI